MTARPTPRSQTDDVAGQCSGFPMQVALLVAGAFAIPAQLYVAIPIAPRIQDAFSVNANTAAWTGGAFSLAYAVGFLVFGPLSDRVGQRLVLAFGVLATAGASLLVALSPGIAWFLASRSLQGFAAATFAPAALAFVAHRASAKRRQLALSLLTTGLLGAGLAGQAFGQLIGNHDSWRILFWVSAISYLTYAAALLWRMPTDRSTTSTTWREVLTAMGRLLQTPAPVAVFASALTVFGSFVAMYVVLNDHLTRTFGFGPADLLTVQALGGLGLIAGPVAGRALGHKGPRFTAVLGFLIAAAGLLAAQLDALATVAIVGSVTVVAGISLVVPSLVGLLHTLVPHGAGAAVAVNTFALFVGASLGQLLAVQAGYRATLAIMATVILIAAAAVATLASPTARSSDLSTQPDSPAGRQ